MASSQRSGFRIQDFEHGLDHPGKTPAEIILKTRLDEILKATKT